MFGKRRKKEEAEEAAGYEKNLDSLSHKSENSELSEPSEPSEGSGQFESSEWSEDKEMNAEKIVSEIKGDAEAERKDFAEVMKERCENKNLDSEESAWMLQFVGALCESLESGEITDALFDELLKLARYDQSIEQARAEGIVEGKNINIDELMALKFDSDGVPHPGTQGVPPQARMPSIFQLAREASI